MNVAPFQSPLDESKAIESFVESDLSRQLGTVDISRLAVIKADARKAAIDLKLLTSLQAYSQNETR
jgi:hypothetical protein